MLVPQPRKVVDISEKPLTRLLLLLSTFLLVLLASFEHLQMAGFLRQELLGLPDQTSAALVLDLVL